MKLIVILFKSLNLLDLELFKEMDGLEKGQIY